MKKLTSIRLSLGADNLIKVLSNKLGVSRSDIIELSVRSLAKREKISDKEKKKARKDYNSHT